MVREYRLIDDRFTAGALVIILVEAQTLQGLDSEVGTTRLEGEVQAPMSLLDPGGGGDYSAKS